MKRISCVLLFCLVLFPLPVLGGERTGKRPLDERFPVKTTGGIWFWGDVLFFHDYRIQKNAATGSYRLLDAKAKQRTTGTFEECRNRLREIETEEGLHPMSGTALIIMHGFGSNAIATKHLAEWFRQQKAYDFVFNMAYPSTMQSIFDHAVMLGSVVRNLPPTVERIDLIGHSLGSIVMRRYLSGPLDSDWQISGNRMEERGQFLPDARIGRLIMLGPPNHGAEIAKKLIGRDPIRRRFSGESGDQLGVDWAETEKTLGIPCCEFAIIAGGRGDDKGFTPLIAGDDDGIVSTEGTKLEGAADWLQFYLGHGELLLTEEVFQAAFRFMRTGRLMESSASSPFALEPPAFEPSSN